MSTPEPRTIKLTLAYDGTSYVGWQLQPGRDSLQGRVEQAIAAALEEEVRIVASGRTDSGVHARGQVVSFCTASKMPTNVIVRALNNRLPADIAVLEAAEAPAGFHARRHARRKSYRYTLHDGCVRDVFFGRYAWHYRQPLDALLMHEAAQSLVGMHDFRSFESHWPNRSSSVRTVYHLSVARVPETGSPLVLVDITADGFLYNMVRSIVGTLVEVGRKARPVAWPGEVLAALDRSRAAMTAPPQGLCLMGVEYA